VACFILDTHAAGYGIYWPQSEDRQSFGRVQGDQTSDRAYATAFLALLQHASPTTCMNIFCASQTLILAFTSSAFLNEQIDWQGRTNSDLMRESAQLIKARSAHINFKTGKYNPPNSPSRMANDLAIIGVTLPEPLPLVWLTKRIHGPTPCYPPQSDRRPSLKIHATGLQVTPPTLQPCRARGGLVSKSPSAHQNRVSVRYQRQKNTKALPHASSDSVFWRSLRSFCDAKQCDPPFQLPDLQRVRRLLVIYPSTNVSDALTLHRYSTVVSTSSPVLRHSAILPLMLPTGSQANFLNLRFILRHNSTFQDRGQARKFTHF
jgi:hypothetical protein